MPDIDYPYMPDDRSLKYVPADHPLMQEAARAREECAGDSLYPVGGALVRDGRVIARAGNGFNRGPGKKHVCPRIVHECKSGEGYELCDLHDSPGHAEAMTVAAARAEGEEIEGADFYMYGHWWACEPCWNALIEAGVRDVYVTDDAHERFHRDQVFAETLTPSAKSAYIAGPITNVADFATQAKFYEAVGAVCDEMGCKAVIPHRDNWLNEDQDTGNSQAVFEWSTLQSRENDVVVAEVSDPSLGTGGELVEAHNAGTPIVLLSRKGAKVSRFVLGIPSVVYHIEYDSTEEVLRQLKQVLRQL